MNTDENTRESWNGHWQTPATIKRLKKIKIAYPEVVRVILNLTEANSKCLELGCGSGTYAVELSGNGRNCLASDISEKALELTKIKGKELYNIEIPVKLIDAYNIPYPDNTFDLVFSDGMIEHLDIPKAFAEMKRVLKLGGYMVAKIPSGSVLYRIVYHLLSPIENRPYEAWFSKKVWQQKATDVGFKNVVISDCGGVLKGLAMRLPLLNRLLNFLPNIGKIYFLIQAQK